MGICSSTDLTPEEKAKRQAEKSRSKQLDGQMTSEHASDQQVNKLLLLGAGESGKSTLFKQMITIYGKGYPEAERENYVPIVYNNVIAAMKVLCNQCPAFAGGVKSVPAEEARRVVLEELKGDEEVDVTLGNHFRTLWADPGIQVTYAQRSHFQLPDSASYFFNRLDQIMKPGYIPTEQDILRSRVRTTGIVENTFEIDSNKFKMYDVGGQRNERKKWIHCFENVTAVLFVAAMSEYDQVLYEDENTNRMHEALNLFDEICNSRWFQETSIILFLNKRDLFAEKITRVSLRVCFSDYNGEDTYEAGAAFLKRTFEERNKNPGKQVYSHITCATDTDNISMVFNSVKDIIIRRSLGEAGLV